MSIHNDFSFFKLTSETTIKPFQSKDQDLNEFLLEKSKFYQRELLATTHILESSSKTVAFFSIFNDTLSVEEVNFASKNKLKKFISNLVSHPKRHLESFPAIKIGRLAVCQKEKGFGRLMIDWIINYALDVNEFCACKFITVDAYAESLVFYEKMGFSYISDKDISADTRQMYLDLTPYFDAVESIKLD